MMCLPLWGKWIEISGRAAAGAAAPGVFPCGGSGLKFFLLWVSAVVAVVSSPVGEVD